MSAFVAATTYTVDPPQRLGPVYRRFEVAQRLLALLREHDLQDVLDVRELRHPALAFEELGRDRIVARLGEPPRAIRTYSCAPQISEITSRIAWSFPVAGRASYTGIS